MYWLKKCSSSLALLLVGPLCFGQTVLWQKAYRSGYPNETGTPYGESAKIANNRYVHAGNVYSQVRGSERAYFLFTNARGDSLGTLISNTGLGAVSVVGNGDGTFTWLGAVDTITGPPPNNLQHTLVKMSAQGQVLWQRNFNGLRNGRSYAGGQIRMLRTPDGYLVGSNTYVYVNPTGPGRLEQQAIDKFDNNGRLQWRTVLPAYAAMGLGLALQANGSYVAAGWALVPTPLTQSGYFSLDGRLCEFTHGGDTIRTKRLGVEGDFESIERVRPTADKGVVVLLESQARLPPNSPRMQRLIKLDSLWQVQWDVRVDANPNASVGDIGVTATGEYWLAGSALNGSVYGVGFLGRVSATGQRLGNTFVPLAVAPTGASFVQLLHEPGDPLLAWGTAEVANRPGPGVAPHTQRFFSAGFGNVAGPFVPDYCRYPPQPNAIYAQPQPDSLVLQQLSGAGPRYAQNVSYRWDLGDGTVLERATGGPVRHRYAAGRVPGPGTAVRLTLTNNLGCTATQALYPWGRPTAAQQARAWAGRATLWPNPATGTATLALAAAVPAGGAVVRVLDALGRVVQTHALPAGATALVLEVGALPAGVYACTLLVGGRPVQTQRLLVQH